MTAEVAQVANIVPLGSFLALAASLIYFARTKGNIDALKEAVATYRTLSEAYEAKIEHLGRTVASLEDDISGLRSQVEMQERAMALAIDEIIAGLRRAERGG